MKKTVYSCDTYGTEMPDVTPYRINTGRKIPDYCAGFGHRIIWDYSDWNTFIDMDIVAIEKIKDSEQLELNSLVEAAKHRCLSDTEQDRKLFLEMKCFWNCEC
jgi:hypothetical protein